MGTIEQPIMWPSPYLIPLGSTNAVLNNATDWVACWFRAPKTGNITGVSVYTNTVTTGCTVVGTLETPDGVYPNAPSGSLVHANATGTVVIANTDDSVVKQINFAGNVAVTKNDGMWFKAAVSSGTPATLPFRTMSNVSGAMEPYILKRESSVETYVATGLAMIIHYDDGNEVFQHFAPGTAVSWNLSSTSDPREVGAKFQLPFSGRSTGAFVRFNNVNANADLDVVLYDADDNVLATVSYDADNFGSTGVLSGQRWVPWVTPVELQKSTWYRCVIKGQSASSWSQGATGTIPISGSPAASIAWLEDYHITYRGPSGGAWTDLTDRHAHTIIVFDQIYTQDMSYGA